MRLRWYHAAAIVTVLAWAAFAYARTTGSPASRTNAPALAGVPAEGLCSDCHDGPIDDNGTLTLLGVPAYFHAGTKYRLTVQLASAHTFGSNTVWGFQLTAADIATGGGAGTFALVDATTTKIVTGTGSFAARSYVDQTSSGVHSGAASPVQWQVDWTAPVTASSGIGFYASALSSDGSGTGNSFMYTASATSIDTVTAVARPTWGEVKRHYAR